MYNFVACMKRPDTIINKLEKAGAITVIAVIGLRFFWGPLYNFPLLVGTSLLAVFYLWFGFFVFNKIQPLDLLYLEVRQTITPYKIIAPTLMGVVTSYALLAVIFGLFFYPGMQFMIVSTLIILIVFNTTIIALEYIRKSFHACSMRIYIRSAVLVLAMLALLIPPDEARLKVLFKHHPEFIEAYLDYQENPADEANLERLREKRSHFR